MRPVHKIEIIHSWQQKDRVESEGDDIQYTLMECLYCGQNSRIYDFDSNRKLIERDTSTGHSLTRMIESMERYQSLIVADTEYSSMSDLIGDIEKRFDINAKEIPFGHLATWLDQGHKRFKEKALLLYAQGSVCNRCDSIFHPGDLTRDHIDGNRDNGGLKNLQLLCKKCHRARNVEFNSTTEHDVSPFLYEGEQCIHEIACVEFRNIQRVPHNEP